MTEIVRLALEEDIGTGDVTSIACVPETRMAAGRFLAREPLTLAGVGLLWEIYQLRGGVDELNILKQDGDVCADGDIVETSRRRTAASRSTESRSPRQRDFHLARITGSGASALCGHLGGRAQRLWASAMGGAKPAGGVEGLYLSHGHGWSGHFLSGRQERQFPGFRSSAMVISAVSSPGARRYSSISARARSASSSRVRMTVPPTPGRTS